MEQAALTVLRTPTFERWLEKLKDHDAKLSIITRIRRIQTGLLGDIKDVGGGVFELRINRGPGYRLYATMVGSVIVLLLCGGDKDSQSRDIVRAKRMALNVQNKGGIDAKSL